MKKIKRSVTPKRKDYTTSKKRNRKQIRLKRKEREKAKQKLVEPEKIDIPIQTDRIVKDEIKDISSTIINTFNFDLGQYPNPARQVIKKWARNTRNQIGDERFAQLIAQMYEKGILNTLYQYASDEETLEQVLTDLLDFIDVGELEREIIEEAIEQDSYFENYN